MKKNLFERIPNWFWILIFLIILLYILVPQLKHYLEWPSVEGEIVGTEDVQHYSTDEGTSISSYAIINYKVPNDTGLHQTKASVLLWSSGLEGKKVKVYYNPDNPDETVDVFIIKLFVPFTLILSLRDIIYGKAEEGDKAKFDKLSPQTPML